MAWGEFEVKEGKGDVEMYLDKVYSVYMCTYMYIHVHLDI